MHHIPEVNAGLAISVTTLTVVSIRTIPFLFQQAIHIIQHRHSTYEPIPALYQDEDGMATAESQARYSVKLQKYFILFACILGAATALTDAIQLTTNKEVVTVATPSWIYFVIWTLFTLQALCIFVERRCTVVFNYSAHLLWQALIAASGIVAILLSQYYYSREPYDLGVQKAYGQFAIATFLCCALSAVPRRPDVYNSDGALIDRMRGVSIYSRTSYSWVNPLLKQAATVGTMEEHDFPELDSGRTAHVLEKSFHQITESASFVLTIYRAHKEAFNVQFWLTGCEAILTFLPQVAIYKILKALEARNAGIDVGLEAWIWVAALGLVKLADAIVQSYLYFLAYASLGVPIRSQLSAVIFRKTVLKKEVKGVQKASAESEESEAKKIGDDDEDEDNLKGMKQGTINLLAIDSTRIADMASYFCIFPESVFGIILGFGALIWIIGWQSLLAGLAIILIIAPINIVISRRYTTAQDKLMKVRDKKMAAVSEALQGIRQIKFSALETQWEQRIFNVRQEELATLKSAFIYDTLLIACWIANPVLLSVFSLSTHAYIYGTLLPSTAFTALAVFSSLEFVLSVVPELTADFLDAVISSRRIKEYLDSSEKTTNTKFSDNIALRNASIAWAANDGDDVEDRFILRGLDMEFPSGELSLVSGRTGSGKSLLLSALLGEADILEGHVELPEAVPSTLRFDSKATAANWILPNNIAYVAQMPWMENASIRDNILFGLPYDEQRYKKTLYACALEQDLSMLTDGEFTEIGANGINLSGGQRWRVSFARALYSRAGIMILDDIFSAVDSHVGRQLFEEGLCGELAKGRTRILVTHHLKLCLPKAQYTVVLEDGTVVHAGRSEEFKANEELRKILDSVEDSDSIDEVDKPVLERVSSGRRRQSEASHTESDVPKQKPLQFTTKEEREKGAVKRQIYWAYTQASGGISYWMFVIFAFALEEGLVLGRGWFIKRWTSSYQNSENTNTHSQTPTISQYLYTRALHVGQQLHTAQEEHDIAYWIGMYAAISLGVCVIGTGRYYLVFHASLRASRVLFEDLTRTILRAPLRWLDTVPMGRVLNRFSKDFETLDSKIANDFAYFTYNALALMGVILAGILVSGYMSLMAAILLFISIFYAAYYLISAREVKRLESNSRSPIFEFFGSTLSGVATIRAFGKADEYVEQMFKKIDNYGKCTYYVWLLNRWMGYRMTVVGSVFAFITGAVVVLLPNTDASMAGFALSFSLEFTNTVLWAIRRYANVELDMNSTERVVEYIKLETEARDGFMPPAAWPTEGKIEVKGLTASYAPELPPVLKNISFTVEARQRLGVVGRTGAGKSSLTLALFQFIKASEGRIVIDGIDTRGMSLRDLRGRMAIIPQDPVLFSGTVRSNLDAFGEHDDEVLWEALERVHLIPKRKGGITSSSASNNEDLQGTEQQPSSASQSSGSSTPKLQRNINQFTSLSSPISEGGLNLSQGQRQLLCLARAIVSRPKILVLDEATSAVDMHTEKLIRESMEMEFRDCTTIVIAHRLQTVVGYDRILVLGGGEVVEFGSPWELLQKQGGAFKEMVRESGEEEGLTRVAREAAGLVVMD